MYYHFINIKRITPYKLFIFWVCLLLVCSFSRVSFASSSDLYSGCIEKEYVAEVRGKEASYQIKVEGELDGENTRFPCSSQAYVAPCFEPNISCVIENIGDTPVESPRIKVNDSGMWFTIDELLGDIITPEMTDAEKARAIYEFHIRRRAHAGEGIPEQCLNPLKFYQSFGFSICNNDSAILGAMWKSAGLKVRSARPYNHSISEVFFDGEWHLIDGDQNGFYLDYDNKTIVEDYKLGRDHYLVKRSHNYGIKMYDYFSPKRDPRMLDEKAASLFIATTPNKSTSRSTPPTTRLHYTLRPEERLELLWENRGKFRFYNKQRYYINRLYNGRQVYQPRRMDLFLKYGTILHRNVITTSGQPYLQVNQPGVFSEIVIPMQSPYVIVGGQVELVVTSSQKSLPTTLSISIGGNKNGPWRLLKRVTHTGGKNHISVSLDEEISRFPRNVEDRFFISIKWKDENKTNRVLLGDIKIIADLQLAPLGMPYLRLGENNIRFKSDTPGRVRIVHKWRESAANRPPDPPKRPLFPEDGALVNWLRFTFKWQPSKDPDGDAIVDYHFVLSDRPDCRWALSPNFEKIISRTQNVGKAEYTIPYEGLLNPGQTYYWRVRACDENGVWSKWSKVWKFTPQGPGRPIALGYSIEANRIKLHWQPSPFGTRPAYYEIYGSNESGFTPDPDPHLVFGFSPLPPQEPFIEKQKIDITDVHGELVKVPGNLVAITQSTEFYVVGPELPFKGGFNRCYYRIQAVDEMGSKSGCTAQIELPHPFIYSQPPTEIRINEPFYYQVQSLYSLGPVLAGRPQYTLKLRRAEHLKFYLKNAPPGITIDESSGIISGKIDEKAIPKENIEFSVVVEADKKTAEQKIYLKIKSKESE